MTMTLPTVPSLPAGYIVQLADMTNLAYAAQFLLTKPLARVHSTGTGSVPTTAAAIAFDTKDYDTDGMWSSGANTRLTVQTPGWYKFRYSVAIAPSGSGGAVNAYMQSVSGSSNPQGAGVTSPNEWAGGAEVSSGGTASSAEASGIWPYYLYAGDYVQVMAVAAASGNSFTTAAQTYLSLEWISM